MKPSTAPTDVLCSVHNSGFDAYGLPILKVDCPRRGRIDLEACLSCPHVTTYQDGALTVPAIVCHPPTGKAQN